MWYMHCLLRLTQPRPTTTMPSPPRQPGLLSSPSSSLPWSPGTTMVHAPAGGAAAGCLPADQTCFAVRVSIDTPNNSSRHNAAATTTVVGSTRACCTTTSYITVLAISFGSLLVILLILCGIRWYLVRRRSTRLDAAAAGVVTDVVEPEKKQSKGLDADTITALPQFVYRKEEGVDGEEKEEEQEELECVVCLCTMEDGDAARQLPSCMHVFHRGCIDVWLKEHSTCPVCRAEVAVVIVRPADDEEGCGGEDHEGGPSSTSMLMMARTTTQEGMVGDEERDLEAQL